MSFSGTTSRVVRRLAHRNLNWSSSVFKGDPELMSMVSGFRGWVANAEAMAEKYSAAPSAIDFKAAKDSVRDKALVDALETLYSSNKPPAETFEWSTEDREQKKQAVEDAKASEHLTTEMIEDCEKELAYMRANRTNTETAATDIAEMYPDIAEETEKEIENRECFKDTLGK